MDVNWNLCCLCQQDKTEKLQTPKDEGFTSLEKDLEGFKTINVVPSGMKVVWEQLDEGGGIAETLRAHGAKYHKVCRTYCSNSRLKRLLDKEQNNNNPTSPKKLRSATPTATTGSQRCIICDGEDQKNLHKVVTDNVDTNLKNWAKINNNFQLLGKLIAQAADAHAGNTHYHSQCYCQLRDSARARKPSAGPSQPPFDPIATAQIVALLEDSGSIFKVSTLRKLYRKLMNEQGTPCLDPREPHSTRFKEYLLELLPEWADFSHDIEGYISSHT